MVRSERCGELSASWMASRTPKHMPRLSASKTFIARLLPDYSTLPKHFSLQSSLAFKKRPYSRVVRIAPGMGALFCQCPPDRLQFKLFCRGHSFLQDRPHLAGAGMLPLGGGLGLFDDLFQRLDVLAERLASDRREAVFRARLAVHERLVDRDVAALLQRAHVHAQVAVRHPEL